MKKASAESNTRSHAVASRQRLRDALEVGDVRGELQKAFKLWARIAAVRDSLTALEIHARGRAKATN